MIYNSVLNDLIKLEKDGYIYPEQDKPILKEMFAAINNKCNTNINFLVELDMFHVPGAGEIVACYIQKFSSESVRAYLIPQLVCDKVKDRDIIIFEMYKNFRISNDYISKPGEPSPAHITVRYDNALSKIKSKSIEKELTDIVSNPRDAFYLPCTLKKLASRKIPEIKNILLSYLKSDTISPEDVGLKSDNQSYYPPLSYIRNQLIFLSIDGLQYYPSQETLEVLDSYTVSSDSEISDFAKKIYKKIAAEN